MTTPQQGAEQLIGFAEQLNDAKNASDTMQRNISEGKLRMNPESAEKAAKVYEAKADRIFELADKAYRLGHVTGMGNYPTAHMLEHRFGAKASDPHVGAAKLLQDLEKELRRRADLFRQAAKDYITTDEHVADDMRRGLA